MTATCLHDPTGLYPVGNEFTNDDWTTTAHMKHWPVRSRWLWTCEAGTFTVTVCRDRILRSDGARLRTTLTRYRWIPRDAADEPLFLKKESDTPDTPAPNNRPNYSIRTGANP